MVSSKPPVQLRDGELCGLLGAVSKSVDRHIRGVAERFDLTAPQVIALRELQEPRTLRALAEQMHCEASNATFVADRLEQMGLLERRPHPTDRRAKLLHLTPEGAALRKRVVKHLYTDSPLGRLNDEQQLALRDLLLRASD